MEANVRKYQEITIDIDRYKKMRPYLEAYFNDQYCETTFFPDILLYGIDAIQNLTLQNYPTNIEATFENDDWIKLFLDKITTDDYDTICWVLRIINHCLLCRQHDEDTFDPPTPYECPENFYPNNLIDDLLKMYLLCEDAPDEPYMLNEVTIKVNGCTEKFHNYDNYFVRGLLKDFCTRILNAEGISTKEEVIETLKARHKAGRKPMNYYSSVIIYGTYRLLKEISREEATISGAICRIIGRFLYYLKLEPISVAQDEQYIRTNVIRLVKKIPHPSLLRVKEAKRNDPYLFLYRK